MAQGNQGDQQDVRAQLLQLLLGKIEQDTYPSATMLDIVEMLLTPDDVAAYAEVLMAKLEDDTYPSNSLIRRVVALG